MLKQLWALVALMLLFLAANADAGWEMGAGIGDEIFGETPATAQLSYRFAGRFEQVVSLGAISKRQHGRRKISDDTAFASYVVRIPIKRFYLGLGLLASSEKNAVISSTVSYTQTLGWRISERWVLEVRHISNLGREGRNIGDNLLTAIYRFD